MPLEIKELHINIAVNAPQNGQSPGNQTTNGGDSNAQPDDEAKAMIVAECVEQVLQILKNKMER